MDLFLLSYLIQQGRYHVAPEAVAEAMLRWVQPEVRLADDRGDGPLTRRPRELSSERST